MTHHDVAFDIRVVEALNLATLPACLRDESEAWLLLERLRWQDGAPVCPHCGTQDPRHYFIASRSDQRTTRAGNVSFRRPWKCRDQDCRRQFSVLVGTIFEDSKLPVSKWLLALPPHGRGQNGISALELQRHLGIAYATAWFALHRLRAAVGREPLASLLSGTVVVDETSVGGNSKNRHRQGRRPGQYVAEHGKGRDGKKDKTPVVALICKEAGEARTRAVTVVNRDALRPAITEDVELATTVLPTDKNFGYWPIGREMAP